jgi:hypothetical protein
MQKLRKKYFQASEIADKAEQVSQSEEGREKLERAYKQAINYRGLASKASHQYMASFDEVNSCWGEYDSTMPGVMEHFQQNEESRIHFLKYSLEKYVRHQQRLTSGMDTLVSEYNFILSNINSSIDIRVFVDSHKSKSLGVVREQFMTYEDWKKQKAMSAEEDPFKEDDYEVLEDAQREDNDLALTNSIVSKLLPKASRPSLDSSSESDLSETGDEQDSELDTTNYCRLSELLQTPDGRWLFCNLLERKRKSCCLIDRNLTQLAALFNTLLTGMVIDGDSDPVIFYKIISLSQVFHTLTNNGRKKYLNTVIANHNIWSDRFRWESTIEWITQAKIAADKESLSKLRSAPKQKTGLLGTIKNLANKLPAFQKSDINEERAEKSAAFMVMSQFNFHMINLGLPIDIASEIILKCSQKVGLDSERICVLLAELQANQRSSKQPSKYIDIRRRALKRRERESAKWGSLIHIGLCLPYLKTEELSNLLLVSRTWHEKLYREVTRLRLHSASSLDREHVIRNNFWMNVLRGHNKGVNYREQLSMTLENLNLIKEVEDVINMDVARSYQNHPHITPDVLKSLLKTYAFFNQDLGYCQGMNYIAGTLYIQLQDEDNAFKCMIGLVERFHLKQLFMKNLPRLKLLFYQLDRLIGILLPDLHEIFKEEMINSSHFSSSWFITLYSSTLQNKVDILLKIWDMFLIDGWKVIFKTAIAILERVAPELMNKKFEDIMAIVTCISLPACPVDVFHDNFIEQVRIVKVTNSLLRDLQSEYEHLKIRATSKGMNSSAM